MIPRGGGRRPVLVLLHGRGSSPRSWLSDPFPSSFREADAAFVLILRSRDVRVGYHVWRGGHEGSYWRAHVGAYLRFYASALARC